MLPMPAVLRERGVSSETVNTVAAAIVGGVVGLALLGAVADAWLSRRQSGEKDRQQQQQRPRLWALFALVASYALLIPGLALTLFQYSLSILTMEVTSHTENTIELVQGTAGQGMFLAAAFITTYAMIIPVVKVALLILGQLLQRGGRPGQVLWARRCILTVQVVSKWASPDMFAYILMFCLFRGLDKPPNLRSEMQLGLGFSCFTVFCVGSTISSLGIPVPSLSEEAREAIAGGAERGAKVRTSRLVGRPALALVAALAVAFAALLAVGVALPVMELRLDMALLYSQKPQLKLLESFINSLRLPELMHEEVSGWTCLLTLAKDISKGSVNSGLALVMYGVFTILIPFLDMLALLLAACSMRSGSDSLNTWRTKAALAASRVLWKLSMLDVSIMGVVVIVLSMENLRQNGVILAMRQGIPVLLGAEICHYLAWFIVRRVHASLAASSESSNKDTIDLVLEP